MGQPATASQHVVKKAFDFNAIEGGFRPPQEKPIFDERILNRPFAQPPTLPPIPPAVSDECVCVPHYQCGRDGYLIGSGSSNSGYDSIQPNAGSYPPDLSPLVPPPPPRRVDHHDQSFLDIDERSNDDELERTIDGRSPRNKKDDADTTKNAKDSDAKARTRREVPKLNVSHTLDHFTYPGLVGDVGSKQTTFLLCGKCRFGLAASVYSDSQQVLCPNCC